MSVKRTVSSPTKALDTPYDPQNAEAVTAFWKGAIRHTGLAEFKRKRGERGPQKAPVKVPVTIRLSPEVVERFRATGSGWQSRIDTVLRDWLKKHAPA